MLVNIMIGFFGQYYFEGRFDLVKFVRAVQEAGLMVHLRIGPYACAEWNYGSVISFSLVVLLLSVKSVD